jgi:hypothetical protein
VRSPPDERSPVTREEIEREKARSPAPGDRAFVRVLTLPARLTRARTITDPARRRSTPAQRRIAIRPTTGNAEPATPVDNQLQRCMRPIRPLRPVTLCSQGDADPDLAQRASVPVHGRPQPLAWRRRHCDSSRTGGAGSLTPRSSTFATYCAQAVQVLVRVERLRRLRPSPRAHSPTVEPVNLVLGAIYAVGSSIAGSIRLVRRGLWLRDEGRHPDDATPRAEHLVQSRVHRAEQAPKPTTHSPRSALLRRREPL